MHLLLTIKLLSEENRTVLLLHRHTHKDISLTTFLSLDRLKHIQATRRRPSYLHVLYNFTNVLNFFPKSIWRLVLNLLPSQKQLFHFAFKLEFGVLVRFGLGAFHHVDVVHPQAGSEPVAKSQQLY